MKILFASFIQGVLLAITLSAVDAQTSSHALPAPIVRPAIDGVMTAFQDHPLVGLENNEGADNHGLAQQEDFYSALIRDPRFARDVGNVVVEFGAASAQATIDRYVGGQDVPYAQLRKVWTDTVAWTPPPIAVGYINFFAQVRAANLSLPPARRIRVWLGGPVVDWAKAKTLADIVPTAPSRETYPSGLIDREIIGRNKKALVIYGGRHLLKDPVLLGYLNSRGAFYMAQLVEQKHPGAFFTVYTYTGRFANKACVLEFEKDKAKWTAPMLLAPVRGTSLDDPSFLRRCTPPTNSGLSPGTPKAQKAEIDAHTARNELGLNADAMLYLGPASSLTGSPIMPDAYLDEPYRQEILRRARMFDDKATPASLGIGVEQNTASPRSFQQD